MTASSERMLIHRTCHRQLLLHTLLYQKMQKKLTMTGSFAFILYTLYMETSATDKLP